MMRLRSIFLLLFLAAYIAADCPPGTIYESTFKKCYKFFNTPLPFLSAEQTCNSIGGHLVAIQNDSENSYVSGLISGAAARTPNYWIGANLLLSSSWSWTANSSFSYANWANGQPISSNSCGFVRDPDSKWLTGACNSPLPFVCAVDPNSPLPGSCPTQSPPPTCSRPTQLPSSTNAAPSCCRDVVCSPGYTLYFGNCLCYKYFKINRSFNDSKASCIQEGGILASSTSAGVNEFLTALPGIRCQGETCPYIGLFCTFTSATYITTCVWADGSPIGDYRNFFKIGSKRYDQTTSPFVLIAAPKSYHQSATWQPAQDERSYICQKHSTPMSTADDIVEGSGKRMIPAK